jgi:adenine-specific DNA-methyltransferase
VLHLPNPKDKALGAYYTDAPVADFLVRWALRGPKDLIADPAFGGGVFLEAALKRLGELGGRAAQVFGVEINPAVHAEVARTLALPEANLVCSDFFVARLPGLDAVVGNPPFIRHHAFRGVQRAAALAVLAEQQVQLSQQASSWAAFVVRATQLLVRGGRLAMVIPSEITHAVYARELLAFLARSYGHISLITFQEPLFPELSQDCLLLLADDKGGSTQTLELHDLKSSEALENPYPGPTRILTTDLLENKTRLKSHWLPRKTLELYTALKNSTQTFRLGSVAKINTGYVSGNNAFFHFAPILDPAFLKPALLRGKSLQGLNYTQQDWQAGLGKTSGHLLHIPPHHPPLPQALQDYLVAGEAAGVPTGYKCRNRKPWYAIPQVHVPDAFLTYMSTTGPRLVVNSAGAVVPNTLHMVRLKKPGYALALAALWQTSLAQLSAEIEGHALGGGLLKLEPREAEAVILPNSGVTQDLLQDGFVDLFAQLDTLHRQDPAKAQQLADQVLTPYLNPLELAALREGLAQLRSRRKR